MRPDYEFDETVNIPVVFARALATVLGTNLRRVSQYGRLARDPKHRTKNYEVLIVVGALERETTAAVRRLASKLERRCRVDILAKVVDEAHFIDRCQSEQPFWQRLVRDQKILWPEGAES